MRSGPLRGSHLPCHEGPVRHLHGGSEPPLDVEQDPAFVGVVSDRFEEQIMGNAVEEGPDVDVQHPVLSPAALTGHGQSVMGTAPGTIAIAVTVEDRLKLLFQQHRCCGLGDAVHRVRHPQHPDPGPVVLRYLHRPHRPGEVTPRTHPVPQLVEVAPLVVCKAFDADGVHARRTLVRLDLHPRPENEALVDFKRLHSQR